MQTSVLPAGGVRPSTRQLPQAAGLRLQKAASQCSARPQQPAKVKH